MFRVLVALALLASLRVTKYIGIVDLTLPTPSAEIAFEHAGERIRAKVKRSGMNPGDG